MTGKPTTAQVAGISASLSTSSHAHASAPQRMSAHVSARERMSARPSGKSQDPTLVLASVGPVLRSRGIEPPRVLPH